MKSESRRKDEARKYEQNEDWEKAIQVYLQILRGSAEGDAETDLPIYNRVGDLYLRLGKPAEAVTYYEQAADQYAEAGLYNNAIALCNKALRHQPSRIILFRKLGQFCAHQGFLTDARRWYLEYADRMMKQSRQDEAFEALEDFASISDDPEVRIHLGRQLFTHDRPEQAFNEFRRAYAMLMRAGMRGQAESLRDEVVELSPEAPDLGTEDFAELSDQASRWGAGAAALPVYGDAPAAPEQDEDEDVGPVAGLESTRLADEVRGDVGGTLEGLDTGRDDTLERVSDERESEAAAPLPLLGETPEPADEPEPPASYPVMGGAPPPREDPHPAGTGTDGAEEYVDLYALLAPDEEREEKSRFFIEETEPTGDEDRDFAELLAQFRAKLAEHVPENDAGSHYDLGLAFKEMGLYDDAVNQFQVALRAGEDRLKVFEELGECFLLKGQNNIAVKVLSRALQLDHRDELELIGVYYHLGRAYEELGQAPAARDAYERVMGLDIRFRDVEHRMARL